MGVIGLLLLPTPLALLPAAARCSDVVAVAVVVAVVQQPGPKARQDRLLPVRLLIQFFIDLFLFQSASSSFPCGRPPPAFSSFFFPLSSFLRWCVHKAAANFDSAL